MIPGCVSPIQTNMTTCRKVSTITHIRRCGLLETVSINFIWTLYIIRRICSPYSRFTQSTSSHSNSVPKPTSSARAAPSPSTPMKRWLVSESVWAPFRTLISPVRFLSSRMHWEPVTGEIVSWRTHHAHPESAHRGFPEHGVGAPRGHHLRGHIGRGQDGTGPVISERGHEGWAESHRGVWR